MTTSSTTTTTTLSSLILLNLSSQTNSTTSPSFVQLSSSTTDASTTVTTASVPASTYLTEPSRRDAVLTKEGIAPTTLEFSSSSSSSLSSSTTTATMTTMSTSANFNNDTNIIEDDIDMPNSADRGGFEYSSDGSAGLAIGIILAIMIAGACTAAILYRRRKNGKKSTYITFGNPSYSREHLPVNDFGLDSPLTLSSNGYTVLA